MKKLLLALLLLAACSAKDKCPCLDVDVPSPDTLAADALDGAGSGSDVGTEVLLPPPDSLWPGETPEPAWPAWVDGHPWLRDEFSRWSFAVDMADPPHFRALPDHAVGNGHVFSLLGYAYPLNTLHSMNGPYYHKGLRFFSDVTTAIAIGADGADLAWKRQGSGKVTTSTVVMTWAEAPQAHLFTVDFAPLVGDAGDLRRRALVRLAVVRNPSSNPVNGLVLRLNAAAPQTAEGNHLVEQVETRSRRIVALGEADAEVADGVLRVPLGKIPGKGDRVVAIAFVFDDEKALGTETLAALEAADLDALLDQTRDSWLEKLADAATLTTPDPRVNDYLTSQLLVVLSQQAYNGSSHPMCEYTRTWLRDNAGPARLLTRVGLFEALRAELDYLWLAMLAEGGIGNSYFGNYQPEDAKPEPDWDSLAPMDGRSRAESPSYIPLMFAWYRQASGKEDFIDERFGWMRYALEGQAFDGDLLPFSTDETFRTAMAVAHGLNVEEQFDVGFYSSNSSFLWVAAARELADMADAVGRTADAEALRTRAEAVAAAAEELFLAQDGHYHPYVRSADLSPAPSPFEDVNTKPLWTGYRAPTDPVALDNLARTIELLGGEDGILVSPLPAVHQNLFGLPIAEGIHTGMSPGYFLDNLALTHHPLGEAAFNALALHATASATTPEYQILDDHAPLHFLYDTQGGIGDYTARYRPWEGGILADAAWSWLLGNRADALNNTLHLAPHLPNGWSWLEAKGIRVGDARLNVRVERIDDHWRVKLSDLTGADSIQVHLTVPATGSEPVCTIDGQVVPCATAESPWTDGEARRGLSVALDTARTVVVR
jgi:hypothetical protein